MASSSTQTATYSAFPLHTAIVPQTQHTVWPSKCLDFSGLGFLTHVLLGTEHCIHLWTHMRAVFYTL